MSHKLKRKKRKEDNTANAELPKKRKRRLRKRYKKQKCAFVDTIGNDTLQCNYYAVGKSTLCKKHGGDPIDKDNLVLTVVDGITDTLALKGTKFNPAIHPLLFIDLSRQGLSDIEIAAQFKVGINALRSWSETYVEFATAYEVGQALHEAWWLRQGKSGLHNVRNFNTVLFKFLTGNKLGYSDKMETKNLNMTAHGVLLVPSKVTEDEWEDQNNDIQEAEIVE